MKTPSVEEMLKAGVHFGHRTSRWHPKMAPYIFGVRSGIHVIDVEKTQTKLEEAMKFLGDLVARGGTVVFVGTKKQITDTVEKTAKACGMPYVNNRWLGGTFTNFPEIQKLIKNYLDLKDKREKGELKKYTKFEQVQFDKKIEDLEDKIGGISTLKKLPEAVFVFDVRNEKTAIDEAKYTGVKVVAICDTNVNPQAINYVIPANDDSIASLELVGRMLGEAINEGKKRPAKVAKIEAKEAVEEVALVPDAKETVDELDDEVKEKLAREAAEGKK